MESTVAVFLVGIVSFAIGAIVGAFVVMRFSSDQQKTRLLEKHLHDKQDELKNYQSEVTEHFMESAKMLKQLAESYRDIHNHLASSANKLTPRAGAPIIEKIQDQSDNSNNSDDDIVTSAPLDYAPRTTPFDRGTLEEDNYLEKVELREKPIEDYAEIIANNAKKS